VVAGRNYVGAGFEHFGDSFYGESDPGGEVFTLKGDKVYIQLGSQILKQARNGFSPTTAHNITDHQYTHASLSSVSFDRSRS
jgi:hypothetical protein